MAFVAMKFGNETIALREKIKETRTVLKRIGDQQNVDLTEERVVEVRVRTTVDEAFWWALSD